MEDEARRRKIEYGRAIAAAWRLSGAADAMEDEERQRKIEYGRAIVEVWRLSQPAEEMEEEERRRKIEYARAKGALSFLSSGLGISLLGGTPCSDHQPVALRCQAGILG